MCSSYLNTLLYFNLKPTQGKIIQRLREQIRNLTDDKTSLAHENDALTQERNKLIDQIKLLQQPLKVK